MPTNRDVYVALTMKPLSLIEYAYFPGLICVSIKLCIVILARPIISLNESRNDPLAFTSYSKHATFAFHNQTPAFTSYITRRKQRKHQPNPTQRARSTGKGCIILQYINEICHILRSLRQLYSERLWVPDESRAKIEMPCGRIE